MDKLWAPWRMKYVTKIIGQSKTCVFCRIAKQKTDKANLVFTRSQYAYSVLNLYPYNNGHVLVLPYRHVNDISKLRKEEMDDVLNLLNATKKLLEKTLKPAGYNIGINLGRVAGAGFPGHVHIHIVPRWKGDVNFMPVVGNTKVISQSLATLHEILVNAQKVATKKRKSR